jgi:predicted nucleic acid-binding protein
VLQKAEEKGIIVNFKSAIDDLRKVGFRLLF